MRYFVRLYRREGARTVEIGPFQSAADAGQQLDEHLATGQFSSGHVDQEAADYQPGWQDPAPWWGR